MFNRYVPTASLSRPHCQAFVQFSCRHKKSFSLAMDQRELLWFTSNFLSALKARFKRRATAVPN